MSLNISLTCKRLVNFFKSSLKMKWLDFGPLFKSSNCDLKNVYDDKLMTFGNKVFFCKVDDGSP